MNIKSTIKLVVLIFCSISVSAQTRIAHKSNVSGKWTLEKSPYYIEGVAHVPSDKTLEIEPGVKVLFAVSDKASYSERKMRGCLYVEGALNANGSKESPILFAAADKKGKWGSIIFHNSSKNSSMQFFAIRNSGGIKNIKEANKDAIGAISILNASPELRNFKIIDADIGVLVVGQSTASISRFNISQCAKSGVRTVRGATPLIENGVISKCKFGVRCEVSSPLISNCNIIQNNYFGIVMNHASYNQKSQPTITNSIIWGNPYAFEVYWKININQCVIQPKIAKLTTGKIRRELSENNIIGAPQQYPDITRKLLKDNLLLLTIKQSPVNSDVGVNIGKVELRPSIAKHHENNEKENENIESVSPELTDVDRGIPINEFKSEYRFALVVGNEDYTKYQTGLNTEVNVDYAVRDAEIFAEYCEKTLGIPNENIVILKDAISTQMRREINKLAKLIQYSGGKAEVIFYYAGHGMPKESSNEAFIMPVDVTGENIDDGIELSWLYSQLSEFTSKKVLVFLDACFSGGARNQGLLSARSVKIKPKENVITGNCVVFAGSSDIQSALPYHDKQHGMFTYYLLKKLKESKGEVKLGELSKYLYEQVALQSIKINSKEQTPQTLVSADIIDTWEGMGLIK